MLRSIFSISNQARSPSKAGAVLVSTSAAGLAWHDHIAQTQTSRYFRAEGPNFGVAPESASGTSRKLAAEHYSRGASGSRALAEGSRMARQAPLDQTALVAGTPWARIEGLKATNAEQTGRSDPPIPRSGDAHHHIMPGG